AIIDDFSSKFSTRTQEIKGYLGDRSLLAEKFEFTSLGEILDGKVRNAEDVRSIIRSLEFARKVIDEKCLKGVPFSFAESSPERIEIRPKRETLFTPLQIEAFTFAKDIRQFLADFEPIPSANYSQTESQKIESLGLRQNWRHRLESAYKLRFEDREIQI